jgi:hypothetical protein
MSSPRTNSSQYMLRSALFLDSARESTSTEKCWLAPLRGRSRRAVTHNPALRAGAPLKRGPPIRIRATAVASGDPARLAGRSSPWPQLGRSIVSDRRRRRRLSRSSATRSVLASIGLFSPAACCALAKSHPLRRQSRANVERRRKERFKNTPAPLRGGLQNPAPNVCVNDAAAAIRRGSRAEKCASRSRVPECGTRDRRCYSHFVVSRRPRSPGPSWRRPGAPAGSGYRRRRPAEGPAGRRTDRP